ncbi:hypothetical protein BU15DRAFT_78079 [Melanogaster broomeanus]|nr:hypothetical protein BU15DRAFT_78079 [Melanogaster broomeanus]
MRGMGDLKYTAIVNHIGEDHCTGKQQLALLPHCATLTKAANFLFPPEVLCDPHPCLDRTFLSPRNVFVDEFNNRVLDDMCGDFYSYFSSDTIKEADHLPVDALEQTPDYLGLLTHPGTPTPSKAQRNRNTRTRCKLVRTFNRLLDRTSR